jgi:uncharacterized protein YueI
MIETLDKKLIEDLYEKKHLSINQISKYLGCSYWRLFYFFQREKIQTRNQSDAIRSYSENTKNKNLSQLTKLTLTSLYISENMSSVDIAKKFGVSYTAVISRLKMFNIPIRNQSSASFIISQKNHPMIKDLTQEKLKNLYLIKKISMPDIGKLYDVDKGIIKRLLKRHHIKIRSKKDAFSTQSYKKKKREKLLKQIEKFGFVATFNPDACRIISEYGRQHGYNFQHALNGGEIYIKELGYWLDGYDEKKNVVCEYYEKQHKYRVDYDEKRKKEILNQLKCKIIILHENGKEESFG